MKSFAILREIVGKQQMTLQMPKQDYGATVADLRKRILELYPEMSAQKIPIGIAVNAKMVNDEFVLNDFDEVALLPPISGGSE